MGFFRSNKIFAYVAFAALAVACVTMGTATILEKIYGSAFSDKYIYSSIWFIALWGIAAISGGIYFVKRKAYKRPAVAGIHIALVLILVGAFITHISSHRGYIHLRTGESTNSYVSEDGELAGKLPFSLTLKKFVVSTYNGTDLPSDYESLLEIQKSGGEKIEAAVAMNKIFKLEGVRLYQASYDEDLKGSTLMVNIDPWGIGITYIGYALLMLSLVLWLLSKSGMMRKALRTGCAAAGLIAILAAMPQSASAQQQITLSKGQAEQFGHLLMNYEGRIAPVETFAKDFMLKITDGKTTYKGLTAQQIITGWVFFPSRWEDEDIISIKNSSLREALGLERYTSFTKIAAAVSMTTPEQVEAAAGKKATRRLSEKLDIIYSLEQGMLLKIFPYNVDGGIRWYSYIDEFPRSIAKRDADFMHMSMTNIYGYLLMRKPELISETIKEMAAFQAKHGGNSLPSPTQLKCEHILNAFPFAGVLFKINLIAGFLMLFAVVRQWRRKALYVFTGLSALTATTLLLVIVLRGIVAARVPLGTGYETMLAVALVVQVAGLAVSKRAPLIGSFGLIGSGFILLVASLQAADPKITPLMPVLSSPLLALHVSVIMLAYAFLTLTFISSCAALIAGLNKRHGKERMEKLANVVKMFLPPALATLGIGIFVGAIWANISWGSYWSWDPKETWSLITFLTYGFAMHSATFGRLRNPRFFHAYIALAFLTVVMTYFGVNMILPGMHSYAGM